MGKQNPHQGCRVSKTHKVGFELLWRNLLFQLYRFPILRIFSTATSNIDRLLRLLQKKEKAVNLFSVRFTTFDIAIITMILFSYRNTVP